MTHNKCESYKKLIYKITILPASKP